MPRVMLSRDSSERLHSLRLSIASKSSNIVGGASNVNALSIEASQRQYWRWLNWVNWVTNNSQALAPVNVFYRSQCRWAEHCLNQRVSGPIQLSRSYQNRLVRIRMLDGVEVSRSNAGPIPIPLLPAALCSAPGRPEPMRTNVSN